MQGDYALSSQFVYHQLRYTTVRVFSSTGFVVSVLMCSVVVAVIDFGHRFAALVTEILSVEALVGAVDAGDLRVVDVTTFRPVRSRRCGSTGHADIAVACARVASVAVAVGAGGGAVSA